MKKYFKIFFIMIIGNIALYATTKIMPLGDSITWDWHYYDNRSDAYRSGYRNYLWYKLQDADYDVDFVGSQNNGGAVKPLYDGDNEGHTGWTSYQIANNIYSWLELNKADIILLHIGTNDWVYYSSASVNGVEEILNEIDRFERDKKVKIKVILAKIINLSKDPNWIKSFNSNLTLMANNRMANGDDIVLVDMYRALNYWSDMVDGIHPNDNGYKKMANVWFNALEKIIHKDYSWLIPIQHIILSP